jgi:hypothetical protein
VSRRWPPLVASAILLAAAAVFVALLARSPADCGRVGAAADDWTARGVVVEAPADCTLHSGDLVTALDGRPLAGAPGTPDAADPTPPRRRMTVENHSGEVTRCTCTVTPPWC